MMTYKEIFDMVAVTAYNRFPKRTQDYLYELQEVDSCKGDVW